MNELVKYKLAGDVAVITIDNPPVNALSPGVPEGILSSLRAAAADPSVKAVILIGADSTFVAGADIKEFGKMTSGEKPRGSLLPLLLAIEDSPKPVVMAIHGQAFGGGLELAMAGHYRVIAPSAQVGQPEVKLGIIPGAAGSQRLPRLAGVTREHVLAKVHAEKSRLDRVRLAVALEGDAGPFGLDVQRLDLDASEHLGAVFSCHAFQLAGHVSDATHGDFPFAGFVADEVVKKAAVL